METDKEEPKKLRASRPKVKTGCKTCKERRVKCDETKPACHRCINFGRRCAGYPSNEADSRTKTIDRLKRKILSKPVGLAPAQHQQTPFSSSGVSSTSVATPGDVPATNTELRFPTRAKFRDEKEWQYFCHFRDVTTFELSGGFSPALWTTTVLEACEIPSIRQLAVAVAALSISTKNKDSGARSFRGMDDPDRQYALQQYGDALRTIRESVASEEEAMNMALISALLIFCFESLHGEITQAILHVQSAIEMILKDISTQPREWSYPRIATKSDQISSAYDGNLLTAFLRLDCPSLALLGSKNGKPPGPAWGIFNMLFANREEAIPGAFRTISEARAHLDDIKWRILQQIEPQNGTSTTSFPDFENIPLLAVNVWCGNGAVTASSQHLAQRFAQWYDAFLPMLNHAMTPVGESLFIAAAILHVQALCSDLLLNGYFVPSHSRTRSASFSGLGRHSGVFLEPRARPQIEMRQSTLTLPTQANPHPRPSSQRSSPGPALDNATLFPTVHAILDFSRRLVAHPGFSKGFVFDVGIIPSLNTVMTSCPDHNLRREAVGILRSMVPRRESIWDSRVCAEAGEKHMAMEEQRVAADFIDPQIFRDF